jgi:hypothetical protein
MTDRGPDGAGIAIYPGAGGGRAKVDVQCTAPRRDFATLDGAPRDALGPPVAPKVKATRAVIELPATQVEAARGGLLVIMGNKSSTTTGDGGMTEEGRSNSRVLVHRDCPAATA